MAVLGTIVAAVAALTPPVRQATITEAIPVPAAVALLLGSICALGGAAIITARRIIDEAGPPPPT